MPAHRFGNQFLVIAYVYRTRTSAQSTVAYLQESAVSSIGSQASAWTAELDVVLMMNSTRHRGADVTGAVDWQMLGVVIFVGAAMYVVLRIVVLSRWRLVLRERQLVCQSVLLQR